MNFIDQIQGHLVRFTDPRPPVSEVDTAGVQDLPRIAFYELVGRARGGLASLNVLPGDRVVLLGHNSMEWVALDLAILFEGAVSVPLYAKQAPRELADQIADCAPRVVLVADEDRAAALRREGPDARIVLWSRVFEAGPKVAPHVRRKPDDVVTIVYTSGTTGGSKGAMITVRNVDFMLPRCHAALADLMDQPAGEDVVYHYLPLCFMGSRVVLWTCLWRDNGILLGTSLEHLVDELAVAKPHYALNVPLVLERIRRGVEAKIAQQSILAGMIYRRALKLRSTRAVLPTGGPDGWVLRTAEARIFKPIRDRISPNLRFLISGSAPLSPETHAWFGHIGVPVLQVYGLTETTAIVTMDGPTTALPGTVGVLLPDLDAKIGEDDELLIRGPNVFAGYWDRPKDTAAAFVDGWFRTGDQAAFDAVGRLAILGRAKDLLVPTTGHNVAPAPIEAKLLEALPGATQAVVIGHARPHLAALVFGAVSDAEVRKAVAAINPTLPGYQQVRASIAVPGELTHEAGHLTANGKLRRAAIEAAFAEPIRALYR